MPPNTPPAAGPNFIESRSTPQYPPPYEFEDAFVMGFPLLADPVRLTQLCDEQLNIASARKMGFQYKPLGNVVYYQMLHYPRCVCLKEPWRSLGYMSYWEAYFSIPVVKWEADAPLDIALFIPYIYVDMPPVMACGREVLGYPKMLGRFTFPAGIAEYPMGLSTTVHATQNSPCTWEPLVAVRSGLGPGPPPLPPGVTTPHLGPLDKLVGDDSPFQLEDPVRKLLDEKGPGLSYGCVQMKQFRDAQNSEKADFQGLVHSTVTIESMSPAVMMWPAQLDIRRYYDLDVPDGLGLIPELGSYRCPYAYQMTCSFSMGDAVNLYINN